jgi:hypothetical protein
MDWKFDRAGQWEGTDDAWDALVVRFAGQKTWDAYAYPASLPTNRHERRGFADAGAAQAWCAETVDRLRAGSSGATNGKPI